MLLVASAISAALASAVQPSAGCTPGSALLRRNHRQIGADLEQMTITVQDPALGPINRTFWISGHRVQMPPTPVVLAFHGQGGDGAQQAKSHLSLSSHDGWATVFAEGIADGAHGGDRGWNVGDAGDNASW